MNCKFYSDLVVYLNGEQVAGVEPTDYAEINYALRVTDNDE